MKNTMTGTEAPAPDVKSADSRLLVRAINIMEAVAASDAPVGINQISKLTKLNPATSFRIMHTLCNYGWLDQNSDGRYTVGISAYTVGVRYNPNKDLLDVAPYLMQKLSDRVEQPVNLMVAHGLNKCLLVYQTRSKRTFNSVSAVGSEMPLNITGCGKVLMGGYSERLLELALDSFEYYPYTPNSILSKDVLRQQVLDAKRNGFAVDDQESMWGACCVAVPVFDEMGKICAAMSVTSVSDFKCNHSLYFDGLRQTSAMITKALAEHRTEKGSLTGRALSSGDAG